MTPVTGIRGTTAAVGRAPRNDTAPSREPKTASGRALIALQPAAASEPAPRARAQASYLAHLIATEQKLPQTRERRRAEPETVIAAYSAATAGPALPAGQTLIRAA